MKIFSVLVMAAVLSACGARAVPADTLYDDGNQSGPTCSNPATYTGQPGVPGDPCTDAAADCSPGCCICSDGSSYFWASECHNGVCLDDSDTCNDAPSATYCN